MSEIKDSGNRTEFSSGAVRDIQADKGRCDLMPLGVVAGLMENDAQERVVLEIHKFMRRGDDLPIYEAIACFIMEIENKTMAAFMLELSMHYKQGAEKYGERNWEKGIPLHSFIDSGVRHFLKHIDGQKDERHDLAFVWNMLGAVWTMEHKPEMIDIPFEVIGGKECTVR